MTSDIRRHPDGTYQRDDSSLRDGIILTNEIILDLLAMVQEPFAGARMSIAAEIETRVKRLIDELARIDAAPERQEDASDE